MPPIPQKAHTLSPKADHCKPLIGGMYALTLTFDGNSGGGGGGSGDSGGGGNDTAGQADAALALVKRHVPSATLRRARGRGLHSSTFLLNVSAFCVLHDSKFRLDVSTPCGLCWELA